MKYRIIYLFLVVFGFYVNNMNISKNTSKNHLSSTEEINAFNVTSTLDIQPSAIQSNYFEVDAFGKVVSISRMARVGKISIFIISTKWCAPCIKLKNDLLQAGLDPNEIDIVYVSMSGNHSFEELKNTDAYYSWRVHERVEDWPTVYITSPNTNVYKKFSGKTLVEEGKGISVFDNTIRIIQLLQGKATEYPQLKNPNILNKKPTSVSIASNITSKNTMPKKTEQIETSNFIIHVIEPNGSLWKLVQMYDVTIPEIMEWNEKETDQVKAGEKIKIFTKNQN